MDVINSTPLVKVKDGAVIGWPKFMSDLRDDPDVGNVSFSIATDEQWLVPYGYYPIYPVAQPAGDVVSEVQPVYDETAGHWMQTWSTRSFSEDEIAQQLTDAKQRAKDEAQTQYDTEMELGYPFNYKASKTAASVVLHIQAGNEDRTNLRAAQILSQVAGGKTTGSVRIKTTEGQYVALPYAKATDFINSLYDANQESNNALWDYQDSVDAAETVDAIPAMPQDFITGEPFTLDLSV